jgi:serine/threonine protein kinase
MKTAHRPNDEPIPGYRLLERIGQGSFGEVWKCSAPGGLVKAIKFVGGGDESLHSNPESAAQELQALERVKSLRHPFLLSIERLEVHNNTLILVTELADRSLHDVLVSYRKAGSDGLPRGELLAYLREAAEVLDLMNSQYSLQHLDIKPRNLFLVGRHLKVGDFGLVNSLADLEGSTLFSVKIGAITPFYAAPETFQGHISLFSDQYSLGVTYHELLTGSMPFRGKTFRQLALSHIQENPDLSRLTEADRAAVARALAKEPRRRFPSCTAFLDALEGKPLSTRPVPAPEPSPQAVSTVDTAEAAATVPLTAVPPVRRPDKEPPPAQNEPAEAPPPEEPAAPVRQSAVRRVSALRVSQTLRDLVRVASGGVEVREQEGMRHLVRPGSSVEHGFVARLAPVEIGRALADFRKRWHATLVAEQASHFVCRIPLPASLLRRLFGSPPALKVDVGLRLGTLTPEPSTPLVLLLTPQHTDPVLTKRLLDEVSPEVIADLRGALSAAPEQRRQERWTFERAAQVWPMKDGVQAGTSVPARIRDVSLKGMRLHLATAPDSEEMLIRLDPPAGGAPLDLIGRVANVMPRSDGGVDVGVQFPGPIGPAGTAASTSSAS